MSWFVRVVMCRGAMSVALIGLTAFAVACGEEEAVSQTVDTPTVAASPTAGTAAPTVEASPTATVAAEPSPQTDGKAPDGCLSSEVAYVDPDDRFAFCYRGDMQLSAPTVRSNVHGIAANVRYRVEDEGDPFAAVLVWQSGPSSIDGRPCTSGEFGIVEERVEPLVIAGFPGLICNQGRYRPDAPEVLWRWNTHAEVQTGTGGYVIIDITHAPDRSVGGMDLGELAERLMNSVMIY